MLNLLSYIEAVHFNLLNCNIDILLLMIFPMFFFCFICNNLVILGRAKSIVLIKYQAFITENINGFFLFIIHFLFRFILHFVVIIHFKHGALIIIHFIKKIQNFLIYFSFNSLWLCVQCQKYSTIRSLTKFLYFLISVVKKIFSL